MRSKAEIDLEQMRRAVQEKNKQTNKKNITYVKHGVENRAETVSRLINLLIDRKVIDDFNYFDNQSMV